MESVVGEFTESVGIIIKIGIIGRSDGAVEARQQELPCSERSAVELMGSRPCAVRARFQF